MGFLNSESMGDLRNADVYDSSAISINRNRIPCSWVISDKIMLEKEKEQVGKAKGM